MKITPITTHPFDKDHPVQLEEDHQHAVQGPDHRRHTEFPTSHQIERKTNRSPSIGGEIANFRNPPLAAKLQGNHIEVFIDNQPVKALVDSGASNSIISETYRRKQRKLTINGRTQPFQFTVMPKCSHDVILGFDFLKASQAVLDCGRAELIFDELLHDEEIDSHGIKLYAMSDSVVPARSCKFLTVQARDAQDDTDFLVEGNKVMCINQGIAVPSMITSLRKAKASIWVTNCENQVRCIPKGMCIANAEPARNDIIVFSLTFNDHLRRLHCVLSCIQDAGLVLNPRKCYFGATEIKVLGHLVSGKGVKPDPDKLEAVNSFPTPKKIHDVRSFLGLCSYYRRFIKNFCFRAKPLQQLLKGDSKFHWEKAQEDSFRDLKSALTSPPVLALYDENAPTELHTDASGYGIDVSLLYWNGVQNIPLCYKRAKSSTRWSVLGFVT
ncbi:retrovirus-related Pol polyprotein from transposon gypsy [Trichonephila clavata]|uniref:RNA-directed DNA polymerase n=1 Tax=Trichonephila clavata TaxID=2740835 RepID=A0A8X6G8Q8_TRICU|nr:retrovirus-related Pol polyprotein from transposon gypsy [Trichonephila clavata]